MSIVQPKIKAKSLEEVRRWVLIMAVTLPLISVIGCSSMASKPCPAGQQQSVSDTLYFGTGKPDGRVSDQEWQAFVDDVITPRFPQGLSVWSAYGQWRSATGSVIQEDSFVLNVIHEGEPGSDTAIDEIMNSYKSSFQQEAVLRVQSRVCVSY